MPTRNPKNRIILSKALNTIFDIASGKNTTVVINFNPLIAGVMNSTKGTKIAIISDKFALDDKTGVITLTTQTSRFLWIAQNPATFSHYPDESIDRSEEEAWKSLSPDE